MAEGRPVSVSVWTSVLELHFVHQNPRAWNNEVSWAVSTFKAKSLFHVYSPINLSWNAFIYAIWATGNPCLRDSSSFSVNVDSIDQRIRSVVRGRILGCMDVRRRMCLDSHWTLCFKGDLSELCINSSPCNTRYAEISMIFLTQLRLACLVNSNFCLLIFLTFDQCVTWAYGFSILFLLQSSKTLFFLAPRSHSHP